MPVSPRSFPQLPPAGNGRGPTADRGLAGRCGRGPVRPDVRGARHRPGAVPAAAPFDGASGDRAEYQIPAGAAVPCRYRARAGRPGRDAAGRAVSAGRRGHHGMAARRGRCVRRRGRAVRAGHRSPIAPGPSGRWSATATNSPAAASSCFRIRSSKFRWRDSCRANCRCSWSRSARPICTASISPKN